MRIIHRVISNEKQSSYIEFMKNFDYELLERFIGEKTTDLHLIQDDTTSYHKQLRNLEKEYFSLEKFSLIWTIILVVIAFLCITAFFVVKLCLGEDFSYPVWFASLFGPALLCILLSTGIFIYKYFKIVKNVEQNKQRQNQILDEIKKLKETKHEEKAHN